MCVYLKKLRKLAGRVARKYPALIWPILPPHVKRGKISHWLGRMAFVWPKLDWPLYLATKPDSFFEFGRHPELRELQKAWLSGNRISNGGDWPRLMAFVLNLKQILEENIEGSFAELGVWRGNSAAVLTAFAKPSQRKVYLFDTYEGFSGRDMTGIDRNVVPGFTDTSLSRVKSVVGSSDNTIYIKGYFPESVTPAASSETYAFVHIDCDLYEPMKNGLAFFYPRMNPGAMLVLHDYSSGHWSGAKKAIDEFCGMTGETIILMPDKSGTAILRKSRLRPSGFAA
jgi:hypothetical protein